MSKTVHLVFFIFYNLFIPPLSADHTYTRQQNDAERLRKGQATRQVRQQLTQERRLKREAFHQVDELVSQVKSQ